MTLSRRTAMQAALAGATVTPAIAATAHNGPENLPLF